MIMTNHNRKTEYSMQNLSNIGVIKDILNRHGCSFSKGLGQNFLINPSVCPRMAEMGNAQPGWGIIEIGAGFGVLTVELAQRADKVVCIEIDSRFLALDSEEDLHGGYYEQEEEREEYQGIDPVHLYPGKGDCSSQLR